jgi:formamidopyrimidine-DNA glycosylase
LPELPEVEAYRTLAEKALDRPVATVHAPDSWFLKRGLTPHAAELALLGRRLTDARRIGKQLLLDTSDAGPTLGLHFGMAGRLVVDGHAAVGDLVYSPNTENPAWDRFGLIFDDGGTLVVRDSRRLGAVELDPDEGRLGPDALTVTAAQLRDLLAGSRAPLKARLMDQSRLAGVGNLIADETLWRARLDPARPASSLDAAEVRRLHRTLGKVLAGFIGGGGSHTGRLQEQRHRDGVCPICGTPLLRRQVGGRTTFSCPVHQPELVGGAVVPRRT